MRNVMSKKNNAGFMYLALLGAAITTLCDGVHVYTQTLSYTTPFLFGQAWWVFPGFVLAFLFMGGVYFGLVNRLPLFFAVKKSISGGSLRDVVETATAFALIYVMSGLGSNEPLLLSAVFYGTFVLRLAFSYDRLFLLLLAVLMALGGMFVESLYAAAGLMAYRYPDVFYVPFWLGGLYVHGAFALREGMRFFVYGRKPGTLISVSPL